MNLWVCYINHQFICIPILTMPEYQLLDGKMFPTTTISKIMFINTHPTHLMKTISGSKIGRFPTGYELYCTMQLKGHNYVFLVSQTNIGGAIHFYKVTHVSISTNTGFKVADGGSNRLTPAHIQHLNITMVAMPVFVDPKHTFTPHVIAWMLIMLAAKLLHHYHGINTTPVAQAMLIELSTSCFRLHHIRLDRQIIIAIGTQATFNTAQAIYPTIMHPILWLAAFHYQPTACILVSFACIIDRMSAFLMGVAEFTQYAGRLGWAIIPVSVGLVHKYYPTWVVQYLVVMSACCVALLLLDLHVLVEALVDLILSWTGLSQ